MNRNRIGSYYYCESRACVSRSGQEPAPDMACQGVGVCCWKTRWCLPSEAARAMSALEESASDLTVWTVVQQEGTWV